MISNSLRFATVLTLFAVTAAAQSAPESDTLRWNPELLLRYRAVEEVALSAAGDRVAYVLREAVTRGGESEFVSHIWLATADGDGNRQYTSGDESAWSPAFSPDGRWLAYVTERSGLPQVWVLPVNGGEAVQVTSSETGVSAFAWAPDGRSVAYLAADPDADEKASAAIEARDVIVLEPPRPGFTGQLPGTNHHLHVVPFAPEGETQARRLTVGDFHISEFDWSPGGEWIVFAHRPDPVENTWHVAGDLSIVNVASGALNPLVDGAGVELSPLVSPDGRYVAYASTGAQASPAVGLEDVYIVPSTGGRPRRLAELPDGSVTAGGGARLLGWTADGAGLLVSQPERTEHHLFLLPANGATPRRITPEGAFFFRFALSRDGSHVAFTRETAETPHDVFVSGLESFAMRRVTDLHRDVPRPPLARTEIVRWTSQDGREIEGLLTYPTGFTRGARVPLFVHLHGGPDGVWSLTFKDFPAGVDLVSSQYFAQEGFAVLRPNPRGSTGYGKEFRSAVVGDFGEGPLADVLSGVDHLIERGLVHPDSLVVMGGSYGGYLTAFAVTRTDRFSAAAVWAGAVNLISDATTTDIPNYAIAIMGAQPWDDLETWIRASPLYAAGDVTTPTMVIHGEEDRRVPLSQGLEFYNALRLRGVPTRMLIYPRLGHVLDEPLVIVDVTHRIAEWFNRHLGRGGGQ